MKTLALLSALATIALAAPAFEEYSDSTSLTPTDFTITQQREKKSTLEETLPDKSPGQLEDHGSPKISNKFERTFSGFKKPIIVKKKIGYSVYRDSEEEQAQADSREACKKQIKVKLCDDDNSVDKMKSASIHHTHEEISEKEMKHSINLAKEAVESFQRDLQKMEHDSAENIGHRHAPIGTDEELRDDIEKARQALEHIQRKFKNLESATTVSNEGTPNVHLNMMKADEERRALWKDTMSSHKPIEIGRNLEENFKDTYKMAKTEEQHSNTVSVKEADGHDILNLKEAKNEDPMMTIVEEKLPKMEIHSDSLIKETSNIDENHKKEKKIDDKLKESESMNSAEFNDGGHENIQHIQGDLGRNTNVSHKSAHLEGSDMEMHTKDTKDNLGKSSLKSSVDSSESVKGNQAQLIVENKINNEHQRSTKEDHKDHESLDTLTMRSKIVKGLNEENHNHKEEEEKATLLKQSVEESKTRFNQEIMRKQVGDEQDLHQTPRIPQKQSLLKPEEQTMEKIHTSIRSDMEPQGSSATLTKLDDGKSNFKNLMHKHDGNERTIDHKISAPSRAASDFHKEILNNMDFIEDSHQTSFNKQTPSKTGHLLKHEKSEFHERLNVPRIQPNPDDSKIMMHSSDISQDETNQRTQLKMATMFNNEQPNLNVQFNTPQTFEQQTNVQNLMPFKSATDFHDEHLHKMNANHIHDNLEIPSDLQDPLQTRWAHENHSEKLKSASQFHQDNMEMDGSSPHVSIDRSMPLRSNLMDGHMNFNQQLNDQQRWGQGKNVNAYKSAPMSAGISMQNFHGNERKITDHFEQLHDHETLLSRNNDHDMMMHGKPIMNSAMQSSNFMHMRGAPKMALEYPGSNQWSHNHGAFRSSYGPASYGAGAASTSGGSAVGLFPNANVGNCAVPLLLSCSPSVVSGSLAKANTYNTANVPSYRSSDINFVKKRDADKFERNAVLKLQKPNTIVVTKL